jgi:RND family efflux transporter MFP subunit
MVVRAERVVLVICFAMMFVPGCRPPASSRPDVARPVKTMLVTAGDGVHTRVFSGKIEAGNKAELAFQVSGPIVALPVKEGQRVKKGELIAQIRKVDFESRLSAVKAELDRARATLRALRQGARPEMQRQLEAQQRAAAANLAKARAEFERTQTLVASGAVSRSEHDAATAAYRVAQEQYKAAQEAVEKGTIGREEEIDAQDAAVRGLEARVVEADQALEDTTLSAPFDGVIAQTFVNENETVQARQPIVKFQDVDEIDVAVDVPETVMVADLRAADIVELIAEFTAAPGAQFPVRIKEIAQRADPVTQTFRVRTALKAQPGMNLLPGMSASVVVRYRRAGILGDRILVPISAVLRESGGQSVAWVIGPDLKAARRVVKLGEASGGRVEIVEGLQPGDRIAVAGVTFLRDGMKVSDLGDALGGGHS